MQALEHYVALLVHCQHYCNTKFLQNGAKTIEELQKKTLHFKNGKFSEGITKFTSKLLVEIALCQLFCSS